jgi:hypothetical protein
MHRLDLIDAKLELIVQRLTRIPAIAVKLDVVLNALFHILLKEYRIMAVIDDLMVEVTENNDAIQSAITLLQNLKALLEAAGTDPVKLAELVTTLDTQTKALAAAVVANTPAA